jgi:hypothetical protein
MADVLLGKRLGLEQYINRGLRERGPEATSAASIA